jgi:hypothetical protein
MVTKRGRHAPRFAGYKIETDQVIAGASHGLAVREADRLKSPLRAQLAITLADPDCNHQFISCPDMGKMVDFRARDSHPCMLGLCHFFGEAVAPRMRPCSCRPPTRIAGVVGVTEKVDHVRRNMDTDHERRGKIKRQTGRQFGDVERQDVVIVIKRVSHDPCQSTSKARC